MWLAGWLAGWLYHFIDIMQVFHAFNSFLHCKYMLITTNINPTLFFLLKNSLLSRRFVIPEQYVCALQSTS